MEYQKIANLLDSASNKPSKFKTRNQVEMNGDKEVYTLLISDLKLDLKQHC